MKKLLYCFCLSISGLCSQNLMLEFTQEFLNQNKVSAESQIFKLQGQFIEQNKKNADQLHISISFGPKEFFKSTATKYTIFSNQLTILECTAPNVVKAILSKPTLYKIDPNFNFDEGLISVGEEFYYIWWRVGDEQFILEPFELNSDPNQKHLYILRKPENIIKETFCNHSHDPSFNSLSEMVNEPVNNFQNDSCALVQLACALDWSFVKMKRNTNLAMQHLEITLGLTELQYSGWFDKEIKFELKELFISNCDGCDPPAWRSENNSVKLLQNFIRWGENNGFGNQANYHLAFLMTNRSFSDNVLVQSFPSRVCAKSNYFVQQSLRDVFADKYGTAHEIAHFFGAVHDTDSADFIMSALPELHFSIPTKWSSKSVKDINLFLKSDTCLLPCQSISEAPVPFFRANIYEHCGPVAIQMSEYSWKSPTEWEWYFPGGTPAQSNERNPTVFYNQSGTFDVTLKVSNSKGSSTRTESGYITIYLLPEIEFQTNTNGLVTQFTNFTKNAHDYLWTFGDGQSSTLDSPLHTYKTEGIYKVRLIAFNFNCSDTLEKEINIIINSSVKLFHESDIKILPNPGNGLIHFLNPSASLYSIKAYNLEGKEILNEQLTEGKNLMQLPAYLPNGIYRFVFVSEEMKPLHFNYLLNK